ACTQSATSVVIPETVTYQGTTYDVTSIGNGALFECSNLTSVTIEMNNIPNLSNIGLNSILQNLTLGENVTSIASGAFNSYSFLQNVTCLATTPPTLADNTVFPYPNIATLTVPCGSLEAYSSATSFWNMFFMGRISEDGYEVVANVNNDAFGSVAIENNCSTATLTATANACYQFVGWNDGNTENPRLVTLSSDTTLTANFEEIVFDTTITATINAGEMYSEFGFNESEAGTYVQNLQTVNGCDSTITLILDVNSSLMDVVDTELSFYPNPTNSKITFSQAIEKVEVIDLTGKAILTFTNVRTINLESLPAGAYYLRLTNNDKAVLRKLIKE
ncbi:MAG: T9SS type A sorting domain-containing protein, partial [Bacteroidales bacterium]|nr:T9SS type A sorting domain-containing protein [Bacteroidales bacterium]